MKSILNIAILLTLSLLILWAVIARPLITNNNNKHNAYTKVSTPALKKHVMMLSEEFRPRDFDHPNNLSRVAQYIKSQLSESTANINLQQYDVEGSEFVNVIAEYGPESDEVIVIGAHYDAYSDLPGADDNASGIAGLIELGKLLSAIKLKHRILLVAYTLEEPPNFDTLNMGSSVHARSLRETNTEIKIMISLEMIGYFTHDENSQSYPSKLLNLFYPSKGDFIAVIDKVFSNHAQDAKSAINKYTDLPAYSINAPAIIPGIDFSDHKNFWENGYPAIMITDTSFYRNLRYHTSHDTYHWLDYESMAKVVYGVFKYVEEIDSE